MYWTLLIAGCAVVVTASAGQAQTTTAACAERDLRVIASIEERGREPTDYVWFSALTGLADLTQVQGPA